MDDAKATTLAVRYGVRSDTGLEREGNEDAAYAGARLLAVADGLGGHAAGEVASAAAIDALRPLDTDVPAGELLCLVRDGEVFQITHDHTLVQSLLDEGKLTAEEAAAHPQQELLLRALDGSNAEPDLQFREARVGDRYLLCSDGLHNAAPMESIKRVLQEVSDPDEAAAGLIALAIGGGGPDNVTCIVADVVPATAPATTF